MLHPVVVIFGSEYGTYLSQRCREMESAHACLLNIDCDWSKR